MSEINIISVSGGKDSLATWLLAKEKGIDPVVVFADTGHEHQQTYHYIDYLEAKLGHIDRVKADFSTQIISKREFVKNNWPDDLAKKALSVLHPTGNPFFDLCLWKGRFPSSRARFCTFELKHKPIKEFMVPLLDHYDEVISWQGVRADESPARAKLPEYEQDIDNIPGLNVYRPILNWSADDVFAIAKRHGIEPNPLYKQGCSRVGCMPCIHARKSELSEIFKRWPEEIERVAMWEKLVSQASKRGCSTFFTTDKDPVNTQSDNSKISLETHGIKTLQDWAVSDRGGRQFSIIPIDDVATCNSVYMGICE